MQVLLMTCRRCLCAAKSKCEAVKKPAKPKKKQSSKSEKRKKVCIKKLCISRINPDVIMYRQFGIFVCYPVHRFVPAHFPVYVNPARGSHYQKIGRQDPHEAC